MQRAESADPGCWIVGSCGTHWLHMEACVGLAGLVGANTDTNTNKNTVTNTNT